MRRDQATVAQHRDLFNVRDGVARNSYPRANMQLGGVTTATIRPVMGCSGSRAQPAGEKPNRACEVAEALVAQNTMLCNAAPIAAAAPAAPPPPSPAPATSSALSAERQEKSGCGLGIDDSYRKLPRNIGDMEGKLAQEQRGKASRMREKSTEGLRSDHKSCSVIPILDPAKDVAAATAPSQVPNTRCYSTCDVRSSPHRPRRDSFGASLQAAITASSLSIPKPLVFQSHVEERTGRPSNAMGLAKGSETDERVPRQKLREGTRLEHKEKGTRQAPGTQLPQNLKPPSRLEVDHAASGSDWMNDEEWLQVCGIGDRWV